jgi:anti-sigma factor RsiW
MVHATDDDLRRRLDGELPDARHEALDAHLARCPACRARLADLMDVSATLAANPFTPAPDAHAAARTRLVRAMQQEANSQAGRAGAGGFLARVLPHAAWTQRSRTGAVVATGAAAALAFAVWLGTPDADVRREVALAPSPHARPNMALTPGATWEVSRAQVCAGVPEVAVIAEHVRDAVVTSYGMAHVPQAEYELDYLITPELGGAPDARNLWPQRYDVPGWNARVKDQLEQLLPSLVCAGEVDLATAQQEIATDWIAAYRKYFHSDVPLPPSSSDVPGAPDDAPAFAVLDEPYRLPAAGRARVVVILSTGTGPI